MSRTSKKFDEQLFNLKLSGELSDLPINFVDALNRAVLESQETGADWSPMYFVDIQLALLRGRRLVGADSVGREVWQIHQGELITPDFIRKILVPKVMEQIAVVEGYTSDARATGNVTWEPAWTYLAEQVGKLKSEIVNRYAREIEGLALAKQARGQDGGKVAAGPKWFDSDPDTVRRRQIVLKNPRMPSRKLCRVFDLAAPPIPLPRDWRADLSVSTWCEAYKNQTGCKRIQKIISTDRKTGKT